MMTKPFAFRKRAPAALVKGNTRQIPIKPPPQKEVMGLIQGQVPMSTGEWRVAVALWKYKIDFRYQVAIWQVRGVSGAQVVDFVVYSPFPIPLQIFGEHWHSHSLTSDDVWALAVIQAEFGVEPIVLWYEDLKDQEAANEAVKRELRL